MRGCLDRLPRPSERPPEAPQRLAELEAAVGAPPRADLNYRLGAAETRAELTAQAESTVKEQLERERERADRLEEELRLERSKGF